MNRFLTSFKDSIAWLEQGNEVSYHAYELLVVTATPKRRLHYAGLMNFKSVRQVVSCCKFREQAVHLVLNSYTQR
jgi:hypothetical protein